MCSLDVVLRDGDPALLVDDERRADHAAVVFINMYICQQQQRIYLRQSEDSRGTSWRSTASAKGVSSFGGEGVDEHQALMKALVMAVSK
jgi:hypothetical protein